MPLAMCAFAVNACSRAVQRVRGLWVGEEERGVAVRLAEAP